MISPAEQFADPRHELWMLLEGFCEDRLSPEQFSRLENWVLTNPAARRIYRDYLDLHGSLYWDTAIAGQSSPAIQPQAEPPVRKLTWKFSAMSLAVLLLVGLGIWWMPAAPPNRNDANLAQQNPPTKPLPLPRVVPVQPERDKTSFQPIQLSHNRSDNNDLGPAVAEHGPRRSIAADQAKPSHTASNQSPADNRPQHGSVDVIVAAINAEIQKGWEQAGISPSPLASDGEWVRRVHLDLVGQIPSAETVAEFLRDRRENKRALLVVELLADPAYVRNFATVWTNLLVGRSTEREVDHDAVHRFLRESFARNRPWSEVVYELVSAEGPAEENGASGFLLAHLNNEAVPATALTARLFLCTQVQCTQCHKHPFGDALQSDFWELNSFFKQTAIERRRVRQPNGQSRVTEVLVSKPQGGPTFYEDRNGAMHTAYPKFAGVEISREPHVNRRRELAQLMTAGESPQLAKAMVNRTWAHFFGYGFTRPVDDMGPHVPVSHPKLLDRLAQEFISSGYDVKQLIRWICLSDAYNRGSQFTAKNRSDNPSSGEPALFSRMYVRSMTAEQLYDSLLAASKRILQADRVGRRSNPNADNGCNSS